MYSEVGDDVDAKEMKELFDSRLTSCSNFPQLYRVYGFLQVAVFLSFVFLNAFVFVDQAERAGEVQNGEEACVFDQYPILCSLGVFVAGALFNYKDKSAWNVIF